MADDLTERSYLATSRSAAKALQKLQSCKIHRHFTGYLFLLRAARGAPGGTALRTDFKACFQEFFAVGDPPRDKPFVVPFSDREGAKTPFFNENVAGSYAASSLRAVAPLRQVVNVNGEGRGTTFSLHRDHAQRALRHLLYGVKAPALSLAVFLYRDYQLTSDLAPKEAYVDLFKDGFGFSHSNNRPDFDLLFSIDRDTFADGFADVTG